MHDGTHRATDGRSPGRPGGRSGAGPPADLRTGAPHRCPPARHRHRRQPVRRRRLLTEAARMHNSIPTTRKRPRPRSRSRGHRPSRRGSVAEQLASLAGRLTQRDRAILRLVHEHRAAWLALWLSERACAHCWGQVVRPDGYGRWRQGDREVDFFLEYDRGTEPLDRLAAKLHAYSELADATNIPTPVLFWLPTSGREA